MENKFLAYLIVSIGIPCFGDDCKYNYIILRLACLTAISIAIHFKFFFFFDNIYISSGFIISIKISP